MRGPKHVVKKGKTSVLDGDEAKKLLDSIDVSTIVGLRDRALIALLVYIFARVSAALHMKVGNNEIAVYYHSRTYRERYAAFRKASAWVLSMPPFRFPIAFAVDLERGF